MSPVIEIQDCRHGVVLSSSDPELIDRLEDFLTEQCFVEFDIKFDAGRASLLFGEASSVQKVEALYERFVAFEATQAI